MVVCNLLYSTFTFLYDPIHMPLTDKPSVKYFLYKTFFVFHQNLMKLGQVVAHMMYYKKVLYITHLMDGLSVKGR